MKKLSGIVILLGFVSLFTDMASEMLYPVMPLYLRSIGFSALLIGLLEGLAEATSGFSKGYFGRLSDLSHRRAPFVQSGYFLSAVSKPLFALSIAPLWVFFARTLDRLGKGIRTAARDAMLSAEAKPETKGTVFGFHRSMDTLGAVIGPVMALCLMHFYPGNYRLLFLIAFCPGMLAVASTLLLKDKAGPSKPARPYAGFFSFLTYWRQSSPMYKRVAAGLLIFALANSSDFFLLMKMSSTGLSDTSLILIYIFYNLVFAFASWPLGILSDRIGLKNGFLTGLVLFAVVYLSMAVASGFLLLLFLFLLYGLYAAATDGVSKAWLSNLCKPSETGTAMGLFTALQSLATLLSSSLAGFLWFRFGAATTFWVSGVAALSVLVFLIVFTSSEPTVTESEGI